MDWKQVRQDFLKLPIDKKKEVLIDILNKIKDKRESLSEIYTVLKSWIEVSEGDLLKFYDLFLDIIQQHDWNDKEKSHQHLANIHHKIQEIKQQEQDAMSDEDAEKLLECL